MREFENWVIGFTKNYDLRIYIATLAFTFSLAVIVSIAAIEYLSKRWDLLYPLPPKSEEHAEYRQDQAVPDKSATVFKLGSENHGKTESIDRSQEERNLPIAAAIAEFVKSKRDLNAQEGMWRAANYLVVLTLVQVIVGAITAWYLVRTFKIQSVELETTKNMSDAARSADRPHVVVDFRASKLCDQHNEHYSFGVCILNVGHTPATDVVWFVSARKWHADKSIEKLSGSKNPRTGLFFGLPMIGSKPMSDEGFVYMPTREHGFSALEIPKSGQKFYILWFYSDIVTNKRMRGQVKVILTIDPKIGCANELKSALKMYRQEQSPVNRQAVLSNMRGVAASFDQFAVEEVGSLSNDHENSPD